VSEQASSLPVMISSENGRGGMLAAMALLRQGGSALDAVESACRFVEDDPTDHSVGYGGLPNVLGDVELDASIMDGRTLRAGAVAAVVGYGRAIRLARLVMETTPHVLLAARGAERLAAEAGRITPGAAHRRRRSARWRERFTERGMTIRTSSDKLSEVARALTRPLNLQDKIYKAARVDTLGTVNFLARDQRRQPGVRCQYERAWAGSIPGASATAR
jgi:beta-aspartyl-peptidase (threonine type)